MRAISPPLQINEPGVRATVATVLMDGFVVVQECRGRLRAIGDPQLGNQIMDMRLDGVLGETHPIGDELVLKALRHQLQDLQFSHGQGGHRRHLQVAIAVRSVTGTLHRVMDFYQAFRLIISVRCRKVTLCCAIPAWKAMVSRSQRVEAEIFTTRDEQRHDREPHVERQGQGQYALHKALIEYGLLDAMQCIVNHKTDGCSRKASAAFPYRISRNPAVVRPQHDQTHNIVRRLAN